MIELGDQKANTARRARLRWPMFAAIVAIFAIFAIPTLAGLPAHLVAACLGWTAIAAGLELLSIAGFVLIFKLVFAARMSWRYSLPAGLRALAASTVLPGGGVLGPAAAARSALPRDVSLSVTARSAIAFLILTSAPSLVVLGALGLLVWQGGAAGPRQAALTLLPAVIALAVIVVTWRAPGRSAEDPASAEDPGAPAGLTTTSGEVDRSDTRFGPIRGGVAEAHRLLASLHWQLTGALAYYAFDNAVLWAAFHAYGHTPPVSIIIMGYLIGSLTGALPLPAGLGIVEGGMIGALVLYGAPATASAGAVLLYRSLSLSLSVIPGAVAWLRSAGMPWRATRHLGRDVARSRQRPAEPPQQDPPRRST